MVYFIIPVITAFIGWLTNWVAIKMLFYPRLKKNFFIFSLQGLIPKRQNEMAAQCAVIIEKELLQQHMVKQAIERVEVLPIIEQQVESLIDEKLSLKLKALPVLGAFINEQTIEILKKMVLEEVEGLAQPIIKNISSSVEEGFDIKEIVEEKIKSFDLKKLEEIVMDVARKEFKMIEAIGAVLGFLVGFSQLVILKFFS